MKESALRLQDKTIFLTGPFNGITQAIISTLTEFGASVAYVNDKTPNAGKYTEGVNESREIHPNWGRAAHYLLPMENEKQVTEALGRVAESLGRMDAMVDATPLGWNATTDSEAALSACAMLAEKALPFLQAKHRGRIIYIGEDPSLKAIAPTMPGELHTSWLGHIEKIAGALRGTSVTVNALSVGVTDDFLLKAYPKNSSLKRTFEELAKTHARLKLVEYTDVAHGIVYLSSNLSSSLSGQSLRLTHGFHLA